MKKLVVILFFATVTYALAMARKESKENSSGDSASVSVEDPKTDSDNTLEDLNTASSHHGWGWHGWGWHHHHGHHLHHHGHIYHHHHGHHHGLHHLHHGYHLVGWGWH